MSEVPLSERLIGTWRLVSREDRTASGERRIDPSLGRIRSRCWSTTAGETSPRSS
jgi:hypothetical protein